MAKTPEDIWKVFAGDDDVIPKDLCKFASRAMEREGYEIVGGRLIAHNYCGTGKTMEISHYWNAKGNTNYDISGAGYNHLMSDKLPDIHIWEGEHPNYRVIRRKLRRDEVY